MDRITNYTMKSLHRTILHTLYKFCIKSRVNLIQKFVCVILFLC